MYLHVTGVTDLVESQSMASACSRIVALSILLLLLCDRIPDIQASCGDEMSPIRVCPEHCTCCQSAPSGEGTFRVAVDCFNRRSRDFHSRLAALLLHWSDVTELSIQRAPDLARANLADLRGLCELSELTTLSADNCNISTLGDLRCLTKLRQFSAKRNRIRYLSETTFSGLSQLTHISLAHNLVNSIEPRTFTELSAITEIDLEHNRLETLDTWPLFVHTMRPTHANSHPRIHLSHNNISTFRNDLNWQYTCGRAPPTGRLRLMNNDVRHLGDIFSGWGLSVTDTLCLLRHGNFHIDLASNPFVCDCTDYPHLLVTQATGSLRGMQCHAPPELHLKNMTQVPLDQFVCRLSENCPKGCTCLDQPHNATLHINCPLLGLRTVPDEIPREQRRGFGKKDYYRYKLNFSFNQIEEIAPKNYYTMSYYADFSENHVTSIPTKSLQSMTSASYLYFHGNRLTRLPDEIRTMQFTKLRQISLHDNPWSCDCSQSWFKGWLASLGDRLAHGSRVRCQSPESLKDRPVLSLLDEEFCVDTVRYTDIRLVVIVAPCLLCALLLGLLIVLLWRRNVCATYSVKRHQTGQP